LARCARAQQVADRAIRGDRDRDRPVEFGARLAVLAVALEEVAAPDVAAGVVGIGAHRGVVVGERQLVFALRLVLAAAVVERGRQLAVIEPPRLDGTRAELDVELGVAGRAVAALGVFGPLAEGGGTAGKKRNGEPGGPVDGLHRDLA
jgi:hypothetical protein